MKLRHRACVGAQSLATMAWAAGTIYLGLCFMLLGLDGILIATMRHGGRGAGTIDGQAAE